MSNLTPPYVTYAGNQTLYLSSSTPIVNTIQALTGNVTLVSPDSSITITPSGQNIELQAGGVTSLNALTGSLDITSVDASVTITTTLDKIDLSVVGGGGGVSSLQTLTGAITFGSPGDTISINPTGQVIDLEVQALPIGIAVAGLNGVTDLVSLTSPDASITITTSGQDIQLQAVAPFDTEGLQNKVGIFPVTPVTSSTLLASAQTPPTTYVPDGTIPTSSTTPEGTPCWLYTKPPVTLTGFNWFPYNPRFGNPTAPLPFNKANTGTRLKTLWALIQPTVNIYTAGIIALNVYTYNDANPPTSGFYNTRWAYSNTAGINSGQTGVNLFANYTYLVYAYDAPRITNQTGVGQPDNQNWGLRDPYDIYTGVHHIPLQNAVVAFNPDATTNYITWTGATVFLTGQTCIFSGFGGTPNGIFYTAVQNSTNQPPVSATGVANTAFWTPISPQPSAYASQPVLALNITGINGSATGWTAGPLLRVLSMGYSVGSSPTSTSASYEYILN